MKPIYLLENDKIRNMNKVILFVLIVTFIYISPVNAKIYNYYFSTSGGGSACSQQSPCSTLAMAEKKGNAHGSGDTVNLYFKRGDIWKYNTAQVSRDAIVVDLANSPIHIDSYDSGPKPIFDGLVTNWDDVPNHNDTNGPFRWHHFFSVRKANSSIKNVDIRNCYGRGITLKDYGGNNFTLSGCSIHNVGDAAILSDPSTDLINSIFVNNEFYGLVELYKVRGEISYGARYGVGIALTPSWGTYKVYNNIFAHNVVYNSASEGIELHNSLIEYNIFGDTSSCAIDTAPQTADTAGYTTTVRYNLIVHSNSKDYVGVHEMGPGDNVGIRVFDEHIRGSNTNSKILIYGNIIINRYFGIRVYPEVKQTRNAFGSVKIFNNTLIDNDRNIGLGYDYNSLIDSLEIYNNSFILYNNTTGKHSAEASHSLPQANVKIENNAFWTTGGSPSVDADWKNNCVITNPKLSGEYSVNWNGQTGSEYYKNINVSDVSPPPDSKLLVSGKILTGYNVPLLTNVGEFNKLPGKANFIMKSNNNNGNWAIGAVLPTSENSNTPNIPSKPENLRLIEN